MRRTEVPTAQDGARLRPRSVLDLYGGSWWDQLSSPTLDDILLRLARFVDPSDHETSLPNACSFAERLRHLGDQVLAHHVACARWDGLSWARIGDLLGVSPQAAQQRFARARRALLVVDDETYRNAPRGERPG